MKPGANTFARLMELAYEVDVADVKQGRVGLWQLDERMTALVDEA